MIQTVLRIYRLPRDLSIKRTIVSRAGLAEGFLHWLGSSHSRSSAAVSFMREYLNEGEKDRVYSYTQKDTTGEQTDVDTMDILTSDEYTTGREKTLMRRTFCFFDDLLSEFPNERVHVPCSLATFSQCLSGLDLHGECRLVDCLGTLRFLNPKDPSYYFRYDTKGTPPETLLTLAHELTEDNRVHILEAWRISNGKISLPREGMGSCVLIPLLLHYGDYENLDKLFSNYPGFLVAACEDTELATRYLLTKDFEADEAILRTSAALEITKSIVRLLVSDDSPNVSEVVRLLSMLGIHEALFGGREGSYVTPPCGVTCGEDIKYFLGRASRFRYRGRLIEKLSAMFHLERSLVENTVDAHVARVHKEAKSD